MAAGVPFTRTRLSQSLSLVGFHQTGDFGVPTPDPKEIFETAREAIKTGNKQAIGSVISFGRDLAELATSFKPIGAVFGLRINQRREIFHRRGINSSIEPFGSTPGPVTTTLVLNRAALYLEDALAAFSFLPGNIAFQTRPLMIIEVTNLPGDIAFELSLSTLAKSVFNLRQSNPIIYQGCWINDISTNFDLKGSDQMVAQNISMTVARVTNPLILATSTISEINRKLGGVLGGALGQVVGGASKTLAANVSIINKIKPS